MANEKVIDAVEKTLDVAEDQLETVKRIPKLRLNGTTRAQQVTIITFTLAAGAAAGATATYVIVKKKLAARFEERLEKELTEAKKFYSTLHKTDKSVETPTAALESQYANKIEEAGYVAPEKTAYKRYQTPTKGAADPALKEVFVDRVVDAVETEVRNVLDEAQTVHDFDIEEEMRNRNPDEPYVISEEEFLENEPEHVQHNLTYFEEDDVLTDEQDQPIPDTEETVGNANLLRFGQGTKDNNTVFIRNEKLNIDFEVSRNKGSYVREVLGFIQHDDRRRVKSFRRRDRG